MLDMRLRGDRRELADRTGIAVEVLDEYRPKLFVRDRVEDGGEDCPVCAVLDAVVEVHWYGADDRGYLVEGSCCRACVGAALAADDVDPNQPTPVEIEYLPLVPRAGVTG
ncbi:MAG TPA: hypothetical protein VGW74_21480 [Propionibacteriaceae bacterium]|nr:hypothetical protein [Propionibacteriaceae bacterium]